MTFRQSVETCLRQKYFFAFAGRASRSEFWFFALFVAGVNLLTTGLARALPGVGEWIALGASLALLPPNMGVAVRRFHDRGLSGYWLLLPLALLALRLLGGGGGQIADLLALSMTLFYLAILCLPGQPEANRYGPPPAKASEK